MLYDAEGTADAGTPGLFTLVSPPCVLPTQVTKLGVKGTVNVISKLPVILIMETGGKFPETRDREEVTKQGTSGHTS